MPTTANTGRGFTLIETVVSIVVVGILLPLVVAFFVPELSRSVDHLESVRAAELGKSYLEEILGRRFDENSEIGNVRRCGDIASGASACSATLGPDAGEVWGDRSTYDDADDYNGLNDSPPTNVVGESRAGYAGFAVQVAVVNAQADLGLGANNVKRIDVDVTAPSGTHFVFSAYKANF